MNGTADYWGKAVTEEAWSNEVILGDTMEKLVINLGTESSGSSDSGKQHKWSKHL